MFSYKPILKISHTPHEHYKNKHRFEHWYVDNQVYFITARCREGYPAFASEQAKAIFWDRFEYYTHQTRFVPWITSLLDNHYHTIGYCPAGRAIGAMMRKLHGSTAKLVSDLLPHRHKPFWRTTNNLDYFDGCIRDQTQCRQAYRYTQIQSVRHQLVKDWRTYPHTRAPIGLERGLKRSLELGTFMENVPYKRYDG